MSYIFTRENNLGVIRNSVTHELVISAEKGTLYALNTSDINIHLGSLNFVCQYSDIGTINGVTPSSLENAFFLIAQQIFIGSTITITI